MGHLGRLFLRISRAFHYWHKIHLPLALSLVILSFVFVFLNSRHLLSERSAEPVSETEHLVHLFSLAFFGIYIGLWAATAGASRIWPVPFLPILTGLPEPLERPAGGQWKFGDYFSAKYRYRFATTEDLRHFVRFALDDPAIVMANRELGEADRLAVYRKWYQLDARCFMLLERQAATSLEWVPAAVSIVLPLSRKGYQAVWTGAVKVVDLEREHLAMGHRPAAVLIDTLIVSPRLKGQLRELTFGLTKLHVTRFWRPRGRMQMEVWVEPDHRKLPRILMSLGFEGPHETSAGHSVFSLRLPPTTLRHNERQRATLVQMMDDLRTCAEWVV